MLTLAVDQGRDLEGFLVRKEPKGHGTQQYIEGPLKPEQRVVIVEDVVTSGGQIAMSADDLRGLGANVSHAICVIDRESGGTEKLGSSCGRH